jgi:hypothetical protein
MRCLPVEKREKVGGRVDRELTRELEEVPVPGHESGVCVRGERDQVVIAGIRRASGGRLVGIFHDGRRASQPLDDGGCLALVKSRAELRVGKCSLEFGQ